MEDLVDECPVLWDIAQYNESSPIHKNWFVSKTACSWEGITCENGNINALNLRNKNLFYIPVSFSKLTTLEELNLGKNFLEQKFPNLDKFSFLTDLDVGGSEMIGEISDKLCDLTLLRRLHLDNNNFTGQLPECIANLAIVDLAVDNAGFCIPESLKGWLEREELETDIHENGRLNENEWAKLKC